MDAGPTRLPRRLRRRRPRYKGPSFNRVVPNLLTLLGLCAGLNAIRYALDAAGAGYLAMLPFSMRSFRRLRAEAEEP